MQASPRRLAGRQGIRVKDGGTYATAVWTLDSTLRAARNSRQSAGGWRTKRLAEIRERPVAGLPPDQWDRENLSSVGPVQARRRPEGAQPIDDWIADASSYMSQGPGRGHDWLRRFGGLQGWPPTASHC